MPAIDDVLANLLSTVRALPALAGVPVYDGPPVTEEPDLELVALGYDGTSSTSTYTQVPSDAGGYRRDERGRIPSVAVCQSGNSDDLLALRARSKAIVAAIEAALKADQSLAGACLGAQMSAGQVRVEQNAAGGAAIAPFVVTYFAQA